MTSGRILFWFASGALMFLASKPTAFAATSGDPAQIIDGAVQAADTPSARSTALDLLGRARENYALRGAGRGYDLKVSFQVNSGGQTNYDGAWTMEDIFDPRQGLRWTANTAAGYSIAEIASKGNLYSEGTDGPIPLRLQEARAALLDVIASPANLQRAAIRTASATYAGKPVICVLFSAARGSVAGETGRRWDETEDCVDSQSGLLMVHSQAPGRYYTYDYTSAPRFAGHAFPKRITVTEAGATVSRISVDSLTELPSADPNLFLPAPAMLQRGRAVAMAGAQKVSRILKQGTASSAEPVCVFGLVTASGKLVEAHSLQPSDPNSEAAVKAASEMDFSRPTLGVADAPPQQHFAFVFVRFVASSE